MRAQKIAWPGTTTSPTSADLTSTLIQALVDVLGMNPQPFAPLQLTEGERPPTFFDGTYAQAVDRARDEFKFLLVYLHSPQHADTTKFCRYVIGKRRDCNPRTSLALVLLTSRFRIPELVPSCEINCSNTFRETLCNGMLSSFLEDNFILWGASVQTEEGFKLSHTLGACTFPFFAILCHFSNTTSMNQQLLLMGYDTTRNTRSKAIILHTIQGKLLPFFGRTMKASLSVVRDSS